MLTWICLWVLDVAYTLKHSTLPGPKLDFCRILLDVFCLLDSYQKYPDFPDCCVLPLL